MQIRLSQFESLAASSKAGQVAISQGDNGETQLHAVRGFGGRLLRLLHLKADNPQVQQITGSLFEALASKYGDDLALRAMKKARTDFHPQGLASEPLSKAKPLTMRELRIALDFVRSATYEAQVEQFRKTVDDYLPASSASLPQLASSIGIDLNSWSKSQRDYFRDQLRRIARFDQEEAFDQGTSPKLTGNQKSVEALVSKCLRYVDDLGPTRIQNSQANWKHATELGHRCLEHLCSSARAQKQPIDAARSLVDLAYALDLLVFDSRADFGIMSEDDLLASRRQYLDHFVDSMSPIVANRFANSLLREEGVGQSLLVALGAQTAFTMSASPSQFYAAKELGSFFCEFIERVAKRGGVEVTGNALMKKFTSVNATINPESPVSTFEEKSGQLKQSAKHNDKLFGKASMANLEHALAVSEAAVALRAREVRKTLGIEANEHDAWIDAQTERSLINRSMMGGE